MRAVSILFIALGLGLSPLLAEEGDGEEPDGKVEDANADPKVSPVDREKAKELLKGLDDAVAAKEENAIVAALEPLITASHEDFIKKLGALANHRFLSVRVSAVKALGSQEPMKKVAPILIALLKAKQIESFPPALAMCVSSLRRLGCDSKPAFDEIRSLFVKPAAIDVMREIVRYFRDLKRLDCVSLLVAWVEQPQPASVNSGSNPPESYWKAMWEIWSGIRLEVRDALRTLTGKEFETQKVWREWIDSPEARKLGVK
ncbi:MAG: hypothetical protein MUE73_01440 [Planctomycetes bacterium]|nr:hypothetical protein [Planctomycetota bacterium]